MSQLLGGSEKSLPRVRNDFLTTNFAARKIAARSRAVNLPAPFDGKIFDRHKISSAIQLPIPGNPFCKSKTDLIGALRCRSKNWSMKFRSNLREMISGESLFHQSGSFVPW